jgi:hypothetical protein
VSARALERVLYVEYSLERTLVLIHDTRYSNDGTTSMLRPSEDSNYEEGVRTYTVCANS